MVARQESEYSSRVTCDILRVTAMLDREAMNLPNCSAQAIFVPIPRG